MQLSVVIVHYEVPAYLEQCLCSLGIALHSEDAEVIVVDNGASTKNKPGLLDRFPHVKWIPSGSNLGFAAGCNLGWQRAQGDVILFLNPDTMITSIALNGSVAALAHAAAVGCRLLNGSGFFLPESKRTIPSIRAAAFKMMGLAALFPRSAYFNQYALG
jgi:GT2 family glycosyltransferase